ncbi:MAG: hypothetical protein HOF96_06395 [Candidatus Marinimicrobia bacterium]|nr:hypothetical protein [Candidatus Neomarinimicrobiota bacterium]MBT4420608.1 hypothetical protein [Candidatus Neomarinimicrobiota bacterium]
MNFLSNASDGLSGISVWQEELQPEQLIDPLLGVFPRLKKYFAVYQIAMTTLIVTSRISTN